jgi:hypothetical protein
LRTVSTNLRLHPQDVILHLAHFPLVFLGLHSQPLLYAVGIILVCNSLVICRNSLFLSITRPDTAILNIVIIATYLLG